AGVYLLARFYPAFAPVPGWADAVIAVGVLSTLLGALMALTAPDLKRVLAYSTVSQLGYAVYAVGAGGILASQLHLFSHAIFKALLFLGAGAVIHAVRTRDMREMGGLGRRMPFTRTAFVIGALALAGLPVLNGFWCKELVLEAGLHGGPIWAFAVMVVVAGLTGCYTFRAVWLVFYGAPRKPLPAHDAPSAMRISLTLLAIGTLSSWLAAGSLGRLLESSLPFHVLHAPSTTALAVKTLEAPTTWLTLAVVGLGLLAWHGRERLTDAVALLAWVSAAADGGFGCERVNRQIVQAISATARAARRAQPGLLGWNVLGIVGGLVLLVIILAWGA
ncbi:MAG: NADH-quinone oxidoreductase subunit L, partial [Candidatus Methylomirabilales bacterium]